MTKDQIALLSPAVRKRTEGEHKVAFNVFRILSGLGFEDTMPAPRADVRIVVSYDTWDDNECHTCTSIADVREHLHACDEEWMCVIHNEEIVFAVSFVWGNSPEECIADWSGNPEWYAYYDPRMDELINELGD